MKPKPLDASTLQERAADGLEALSILAAERDAFRDRSQYLEADNALKAQHIEQVTRQNETLKAERDHWMRYSTELATNMNNVQNLINDVVKQAETAAYRRTSGAPSPTINKLEAATQGTEEQDTLNLRGLIARLPRNYEDRGQS